MQKWKKKAFTRYILSILPSSGASFRTRKDIATVLAKLWLSHILDPNVPQIGLFWRSIYDRKSTTATLQLHASLHIFLKRIWHKLCNISIKFRVYFQFSDRFLLQVIQNTVVVYCPIFRIAHHFSCSPLVSRPVSYRFVYSQSCQQDPVIHAAVVRVPVCSGSSIICGVGDVSFLNSTQFIKDNCSPMAGLKSKKIK